MRLEQEQEQEQDLEAAAGWRVGSVTQTAN